MNFFFCLYDFADAKFLGFLDIEFLVELNFW